MEDISAMEKNILQHYGDKKYISNCFNCTKDHLFHNCDEPFRYSRVTSSHSEVRYYNFQYFIICLSKLKDYDAF